MNFKDIKTGLRPEMLREMVGPRDRQAGLGDPVEDEDIDAGVRIEQWLYSMLLSWLGRNDQLCFRGP